LLQDAAVLYSVCPSIQLFSYWPFNTKPFREFAIGSAAIIAHAKSEARLAYQNMPEQRREQEENMCQLQALGEQYSKVEGLLSQLLESAQPISRKGRKGMLIPSSHGVNMC
jgi:hypothetical protein